MNAAPVCYAQPDKAKSQRVMEAFAAGCGGRMAWTTEKELQHAGDVAFYGVRPPWLHLWRQAKSDGWTRYLVDNSFLDAGREKYFRVGVNALQTWSQKPSDGSRLKALGIEVKPWRTAKDGAIYICPQSVEFMQTHFNNSTWTEDMFASVKKLTRRPAILRNKKDGEPFAEVLKRAWIVVAHSSAAANEALLAGVPVHVTDPVCAAAAFSTPLDRIDSPLMPDGRPEWAQRLADSQYSLDEFRSGYAWKAINE